MDKRVLVFSRYREVQQGIEPIIRNYFMENFKRIYENIEIQKFFDIGESVDLGKKVGVVGGELLVVFDRKLTPEDDRKLPLYWTLKDRIRDGSLKALFEITKKICDDWKIPYLIYEGEIEKGEENLLIGKLNKINGGIEARLEELEKGSIDSFIRQ